MAVRYPPDTSDILVCHFVQAQEGSLRGSVVPEMVKTRPVAVVSAPGYAGYDRCIVVCLSTTAPRRLKPWHYEITWETLLPSPYDRSAICWALGDQIYTVSYKRLSLFSGGKDSQGKRLYLKRSLSPEQMVGVRSAIRAALFLED